MSTPSYTTATQRAGKNEKPRMIKIERYWDVSSDERKEMLESVLKNEQWNPIEKNNWT